MRITKTILSKLILEYLAYTENYTKINLFTAHQTRPNPVTFKRPSNVWLFEDL